MKKPLFLLQLSAIDDTFVEAINQEKRLYMPTFIKGHVSDNSCGYAACVCGHQAIAGDLTHFLNALGLQYEGPAIHNVGNEFMSGIANRVASDLRNACYGMFGNHLMVHSLFLGPESDRQDCSEWSGLFSEDELKHPHLTTASNMEHALSYVRLCIEKVENHIKEQAL